MKHDTFQIYSTTTSFCPWNSSAFLYSKRKKVFQESWTLTEPNSTSTINPRWAACDLVNVKRLTKADSAVRSRLSNAQPAPRINPWHNKSLDAEETVLWSHSFCFCLKSGSICWDQVWVLLLWFCKEVPKLSVQLLCVRVCWWGSRTWRISESDAWTSGSFGGYSGGSESHWCDSRSFIAC